MIWKTSPFISPVGIRSRYKNIVIAYWSVTYIATMKTRIPCVHQILGSSTFDSKLTIHLLNSIWYTTWCFVFWDLYNTVCCCYRVNYGNVGLLLCEFGLLLSEYTISVYWLSFSTYQSLKCWVHCLQFSHNLYDGTFRKLITLSTFQS
jgi:hypothetical protein